MMASKLQFKSIGLKVLLASLIGFAFSPSYAEVLSGRFSPAGGKCAYPISINLNGDRLTVYAKDNRGEFTRRFERTAGDAALFNAVDGLGGSVRYRSRNTLTVDQPDLGMTCTFRRSEQWNPKPLPIYSSYLILIAHEWNQKSHKANLRFLVLVFKRIRIKTIFIHLWQHKADEANRQHSPNPVVVKVF